MFNMLESLAKSVVGVATLPVTVVADIATLGGSITDKEVPYTYEAVSDIIDNLTKAVKPE